MALQVINCIIYRTGGDGFDASLISHIQYHIGVRILCDISVYLGFEISFCVNCLADSQYFYTFAAVNQKV